MPRLPKTTIARGLHIALMILAFAGAWLGLAPQPGGPPVVDAQTAAPQAASAVYLPMVVTRGGKQSPPPQPQAGAFFVEPGEKTGRPGVAIDAQGGLHMAYRYHVPYAEHPQAVYAYCPPPAASCTSPARWRRLAFLDRVDEVQLELTPQGKPRLLIMMGETETSFSSLFVYAECDANCLVEDSWSALGVQTRYDTVGRAFEYYTPKRYFELDPQGRPRFVYYDNNYTVEPDHIGGFYLWCDADCTEPGTWSETRFTAQSGYNNESISEPVLKFTRDGRPRILSLLYPLGNGTNGPLRFELYYIGCDSDCEYQESWRRTPVVDRGSGYQPAWDLELDAADNPRAVNYQSGERKLFYHSCDGDCLSPGGWKTLDMALDGNWGMGADLEIDARGRSHLVFLNTSVGLGQMICDRACAQRASWKERVIETLDDLDTAYPVARPVTCNNGLWYTYSPTVTFDAAGTTHIIYDAAYEARCQYVDPTKPAPPTDVFHEIWHSVRYVAMP